ncbi:type II toxin-antitoxin system HipA family toxin [Sulfuricurvum sp.]|uniref:type II toxin-antitoxin system HipA family toxin n=1 Tax=Sulfuricurvum sp. TaxID=2025608 RepID=UPI00286D7274|nr:type II toxin-antitoxin system HipA family toxin [Sulfuricurvum sp.]
MKIFVIKNNISIGTLAEDKKGNITFDYAESITSSQYLIGLKDKTNKSQTLFPVFENLLPENEQLNNIRYKHNIKRTIDLLLYLDNIHGSLEFYSENDFKNIQHKTTETFVFTEVKSEILQSDYVFPNILNDYHLNIPNDKLYPAGLSGSKLIGLSGFQYKFSIHKNDTLNEITFDSEVNSEVNSEYIMKPYNIHYSKHTPNIKESAYIPYLLINEHIFMTLARDFGFDVPYNAIIKHNDDYHYIIKRYDRFNGLKIDHHEILTLINKPSSEKYKVSCKEAVSAVSEYLNEEEMLQLFRFIVFSIVISHGDLHAKNISLIRLSNSIDEKSMTLAPHYDISTIGIYKDIDDNDIGMMVKNKKKNITIDDLLWLSESMGIGSDMAMDEIDRIASKFISEFKNYITLLPQEIRVLPIYKGRYKQFDTLEIVFTKFYDKRCGYIKKYLLKNVAKVDDNLWE